MAASQTIKQLESARGLALSDGLYYPSIIPGVLPIIGANAEIEIRRWGAEFLAEAFSSPTWSADAKKDVCLSVLPTLKEYLEMGEDRGLVKSAVQAAASIYPLVYKHIISDPNDSHNWQIMAAIKLNILRRMDSAPPGVRICCVKFVQQVVLVETPGLRTDQDDVSLSMFPRDHPLIQYSMLEAESSGLLDRLLDIIHGPHSDALLITATLNCLGSLLQRRPQVANRVLQSLLNFNPLKLANSPMTPKNKVMMKSIEKTNKMLLTNFMKHNHDSPFNPRIQQHLERISRMRVDILDAETNRKRPAPVEPTDGLDPAKRQRLGAVPAQQPLVAPPLPPGPVSFAQLFTLAPPGSSNSFDVSAIPADMVLTILVPLLQSIDQQKLEQATGLVRQRYTELCKTQAKAASEAAAAAATTAIDDEDEYEPDFDTVEDAEQIVNKLDSAPEDPLLPARPIPDTHLAAFKLPEAPPLTPQEIQKYGDDAVKRLFGMVSSFDETEGAGALAKKSNNAVKLGFNRVAASASERDSWLTIITRLATRSASGLEQLSADSNGVAIKSEYGSMTKDKKGGNFSIAERIREALFAYIMYDWRSRIDVATNWLCEEWYNDRIQAEALRNRQHQQSSSTNGSSSPPSSSEIPHPSPNYQKWTLRILDAILPYVEGSDKMLIRLLSEIPEIDVEILKRVKAVAEDPDRIGLSVLILQYLSLFRPPARQMVGECLEGMWRDNEQARPFTKKLLMKLRPGFLEEVEEQKVVKGE